MDSEVDHSNEAIASMIDHPNVISVSQISKEGFGTNHLPYDSTVYRWYYVAVEKKAKEWLCVEQSHELFSDIRGRGGASNACLHS